MKKEKLVTLLIKFSALFFNFVGSMFTNNDDNNNNNHESLEMFFLFSYNQKN